MSDTRVTFEVFGAKWDADGQQLILFTTVVGGPYDGQQVDLSNAAMSATFRQALDLNRGDVQTTLRELMDHLCPHERQILSFIHHGVLVCMN